MNNPRPMERLPSPDPVLLALRELSILAPQTSEYIEFLLHALEGFEESEFYRQSPEELHHAIEDIDEIVEEIRETFEKECESLAGADQKKVRNAVTPWLTLSLDHTLAVHFLRPIFSRFAPSTADAASDVESSHIFSRFRVPNLNLSHVEMERFYVALGLHPDTEGGRGSHVKWHDPLHEVNTPMIISYSGKKWFKREVKALLDKGMSLERIQAACVRCKILFEKK